eukprot:CAMPEP_0198237432 /NCGR_PEP_ID=MMETSP1446-20131203/3292_1 /TAXON_ID=1461542 ORGANISM="Unidentified sp, Strain CCMP2111" /NCGR_SAMPLE_ID=MMETSP1446 /ASSEMBLY_ACC=CAM_ASM_001112 /LENGTH=329 /DNA_ID=CAMNT_0043919599 /DNA_START=199 /DNA_END=1188 /DNA_ORIENTATION=-
MDWVGLVCAGFLLAILFAVGVFAIKALQAGELRHKHEMEALAKEEETRGKHKPAARHGGRDGAGGLARMRASASLRRRRRAQQDGSSSDESDHQGGDAPEEDASARAASDPEEEEVRGKKGLRRDQKKARAEADRAAADAKFAKQEARMEKRRLKEQEREERDRLEEEERRKQEDARQKQEDEEASKWLDMIQVENTGSGEADVVEEDQGLLQRFVDFIKSQKTVNLEDLAAEFGLRVQDAINRLNGLEAMGRITGVMDDRGKFIYISPEEMRAVADYLEKRGRVGITELANKSNEFIDLVPKEGDAAVDRETSEDLFAQIEQEAMPAA